MCRYNTSSWFAKCYEVTHDIEPARDTSKRPAEHKTTQTQQPRSGSNLRFCDVWVDLVLEPQKHATINSSLDKISVCSLCLMVVFTVMLWTLPLINSNRPTFGGGPCATPADCSLAGICNLTTRTCECDVGFKGEKCAALAFTGDAFQTVVHLPTRLPIASNGTVQIDTVWGGHALMSTSLPATGGRMSGTGEEEGSRASPPGPTPWHWVGSAMPGSLGNWATGSMAVHAVASAPTGPFTLNAVALHPAPGDLWDSG